MSCELTGMPIGTDLCDICSQLKNSFEIDHPARITFDYIYTYGIRLEVQLDKDVNFDEKRTITKTTFDFFKFHFFKCNFRAEIKIFF